MGSTCMRSNSQHDTKSGSLPIERGGKAVAWGGSFDPLRDHCRGDAMLATVCYESLTFT